MRIAPKNIYLLALVAFISESVCAQSTPPPPPVPVGPGFPIDENLIVLAIAGFVLAAYFFKNKKITAK